MKVELIIQNDRLKRKLIFKKFKIYSIHILFKESIK